MTDINELLDRVENTLQAKGADVEDFEATATLRARIKALEEQMATARKFATLRRLSRYEKALREIAELEAENYHNLYAGKRIARQALTYEEEK